MSEYVSKEELKEFFESIEITVGGRSRVVGELIRCRDCKYAKKIYIKNPPWLKQWEYSCEYFNTDSVAGDGFCSNAEPKE